MNLLLPVSDPLAQGIRGGKPLTFSVKKHEGLKETIFDFEESGSSLSCPVLRNLSKVLRSLAFYMRIWYGMW